MDLGSRDVDVVVVGAGAAGLGAAARLTGPHAAGKALSVVVLEARDRVGGRGHTVHAGQDLALDLGCGWLHSADRNEWTAIAGRLGFEVNRSRPPWERPALTVNFPADKQKAYSAAFAAFEDRLERAAETGPDRAASTLFTEADRPWRPLLDAFSGYYNGVPFERISVHDYAAYQPTEENWRVVKGYGALMSAYAAPLPVVLETPVSLIDHSGPRLKVVTAKGTIEAKAVIVAVPTAVLAKDRLAFDPPLPGKRDAAAALPLGHVNKAFLRLDEPRAFAADTRVYGRIDTTDTGSYTLRPLGGDVAEAYFGGDLAGALEAGGAEGLFDFAVTELTGVFGSDFARRLHPLAASSWTRDPYALGAYSHAKPGMAGMRAVLAEPVDGRLFFAGEACSPHAFSTAHGAFETGVAAAEAVLAAVR